MAANSSPAWIARLAAAAACAMFFSAAAAQQATDSGDTSAGKLRYRYSATLAGLPEDAGVSSEMAEPDRRGLGLRPSGSSVRFGGYVQTEIARTITSPAHWSKMLVRGELSAQGTINEQIKWKLSGRVDYDAVYDLTNFYPGPVREDQRFNLTARENYLDFSAGGWDFRLGRQHIVWGEIVGLFFADVVSAKDFREFLLPEFQILRIPQWAARAEYGTDTFHAELVWIPLPSYDKIGEPGAEFFSPLPPVPPGFATAFAGQTRPARNLSNTNYGVRFSTLQSGWDVSAFYYRSLDTAPTFYRAFVPAAEPSFVFQTRHDRITQFGSTVGKDFGPFVLKGEAVYTRGRQFNVVRVADDNGVVPQNTLDWVLGLDFTLPADTRLNVQLFQRMFFDHDPDIIFKRHENGYSVLLSQDVTPEVEAQVLWIASLERADWMLRPRVAWKFERNWRLAAGFDIFHGPPFGFFGRFDRRDRAYTELRYSF